MAREQWKDIAGYEGHYQVSTLGNVRRLDRWIQHSGKAGRGAETHDHFLKGGPCKFWMGNDGYPQVNLNRDGKGKIVRLHVLVLETFVGPRPAKADACHNNGNRSDNRVCNLRWGSRAENQRDRNAHGTGNQGEKHPLSKLTKENVIAIRTLRMATGESYNTIAKELNLPAGAVFGAAVGDTWEWLQDPPPCPRNPKRVAARTAA